ncbi:uncharacterized protein LOC133151273 [Syngnathus typhle]|uniref:uncharacterized protein LOC133151273 n=1 Tax=Syngnathus typhle TaxID=161592 RepID=UPI002A69FF9C|nr:uncharacterized protein LOC133151273 [Syngnathus typhle]
MNFSKLLCLVLVYSEQFGQVLAAAAHTGAVCTGGNTPVTCKRKKGQDVKLKVTGAGTITWKKGGVPVEKTNPKYEVDDSENSLKIKTLAEDDEGEYTAGGTSPEQKFQVQAVDCLGGKSPDPAGLCQGKPGGIIKLGLTQGDAFPLAWKKAGRKIVDNTNKYDGLEAATLTINNLDDEGDDAEFTGGTNGDGEKFSVQVADCFGATGTVKCPGKLGKKLKLRISAAVAGSEVKWEKEGGNLPVDKKEVGEKHEGLKLPGLTAADVGTYKATYNSNKVVVSFAVSVPDESGTSEDKKATEKPKEGSGVGGLSYSPALLVTVTLVHLLLQLAA